MNGFFMGGKAGLHGPQLEQQGTDLVAAVHGNGRVELPGCNLAEHPPDLLQGANNGADQHGAQEAQQGHGGQQCAQCPLACLGMASHACLVGGMGELELQICQCPDVEACAFVQVVRRVGQALGVCIVQHAQGIHGGFDRLLQVDGTLAGEALGQRGLLRPFGCRGIRRPQLVDGEHVALDGLCGAAGFLRLQGGA